MGGSSLLANLNVDSRIERVGAHVRPRVTVIEVAAFGESIEASIQRLDRRVQSFDVASLETIAPIANAKGTDIPT